MNRRWIKDFRAAWAYHSMRNMLISRWVRNQHSKLEIDAEYAHLRRYYAAMSLRQRMIANQLGRRRLGGRRMFTT